MSEGLVHYEVFMRRTAGASWTLELATETKAHAIETAESLVADKRAVAARVTKEILDTSTGEFRSITLTTLGDLTVARPRSRRPLDDDATAPLCAGPADLYTVHGREQIGRLLEAWLRRKTVTAFELLHRPDLAEALDASGMELQHAIQKIAIPEAPSTGLTTHELIRHYQGLVDKAVARVVRDGRRRAFPDLAGRGTVRDNFLDAAVRLTGAGDGQYLLGGAVAEYLRPATSWSAKISRLLDLADAAPREGGVRNFAFSVLSQPLSEILGMKGGLADLMAADQDLGTRLALMTRLMAAGELNALLRIDPSLEAHYPPLTPEITRLALWLKDEALTSVRATLARRITTEINGPRRLRPSDAAGEIQILRALATVLMAAAGGVLPADDVQAAFTERSRSLVASDFVQAYLEGAGGALAEVQALVRLGGNVVGAANKRAAVKWIAATVASPRFEREMRAGPDGPNVRLTQIVELQRSLEHLGLPEGDRGRLVQQLSELGGQIEADWKLVQSVGRSPAPLAHRLTILLNLAVGETGPLGAVAGRARAELQRLMRSPEARTALAHAPELVGRLKELSQAA